MSKSSSPPPDKARQAELERRLRDPSTAREAFGEAIHAFTEPLYRQIRRLVNDHDDANDLLQNTFLKAWQSIDNFRGDARLSTWLHKIAINESLTFLENRRKRANISLDDPDTSQAHLQLADSGTPLDGDKLAVELRNFVATLPERQQLVFNMRYYDEMPYEEISNILGTSVGALKASYHHAVKKIERYFDGGD